MPDTRLPGEPGTSWRQRRLNPDQSVNSLRPPCSPVSLYLAQLRQLLERGCYVEMDNFGASRTRKVTGIDYPDDDERLDVVARLLDDGFEMQTLLSHDINHRNSLIANGGWGYQHSGTSISRNSAVGSATVQ